jgi:hypothetical protein
MLRNGIGEGRPITCLCRNRGISLRIQNLVPEGGGWPAQLSGRLTPNNDPVHIVEKAVWATGSMWTGAVSLTPDRPPVTSCYADWLIPAAFVLCPSWKGHIKIRQRTSGGGWGKSFQKAKLCDVIPCTVHSFILKFGSIKFRYLG